MEKKYFSNEVKIALVAVLGIVILFFGMQFLKGMNLFSTSNAYLMKFDNINGLSASTPIYANGYKVGTVHSIAYNYTQPGDITVVADIEKDMKIPEGTEAEIVSDLMGNIQGEPRPRHFEPIPAHQWRDPGPFLQRCHGGGQGDGTAGAGLAPEARLHRPQPQHAAGRPGYCGNAAQCEPNLVGPDNLYARTEPP